MNLLLAAVLLMQGNPAEETFKQIEDGIEKAKSIHVGIEAVVEWKVKPRNNQSATGTLMAAEGNRVSEYLKMIQQGFIFDSETRCDGKAVWAALKGIVPVEPSSVRSNFNAKVARVGILLSSLLIRDQDLKKGEDLKRSVALSNFQQGDGDATGKTLTYTLSFSGPLKDMSAEVTLWYEGGSLKLLKRVSVIKEKGVDKGTVTETYKIFVLNADIPDEKFKLPEEKK
jgi:hypothetical protein